MAHDDGQRAARGARSEAQTGRGWGVAAFIVILALALVTMAYSYHKARYRSPTDPSVVSVATGARTNLWPRT